MASARPAGRPGSRGLVARALRVPVLDRDRLAGLRGKASCSRSAHVLLPTPPFFARSVIVRVDGTWSTVTHSIDSIRRISETPYCALYVETTYTKVSPAIMQHRSMDAEPVSVSPGTEVAELVNWFQKQEVRPGQESAARLRAAAFENSKSPADRIPRATESDDIMEVCVRPKTRRAHPATDTMRQSVLIALLVLGPATGIGQVATTNRRCPTRPSLLKLLSEVEEAFGHRVVEQTTKPGGLFGSFDVSKEGVPSHQTCQERLD